MKQKILDYVKRFNGGVTFVELARMLGDQANGNLAMCSARNEAIVYWAGMSAEFIDAIRELLDEYEITLKPTSLLVYAVDGASMALPLVKGNYNYKRDHWLPLVFNLGPGGLVDIPPQVTIRRQQ